MNDCDLISAKFSKRLLILPEALRVASFDDDAGDFDTAAEDKTKVCAFESIVQRDAFNLVRDLDVDRRTTDSVEREAVRRIGAGIQTQQYWDLKVVDSDVTASELDL